MVDAVVPIFSCLFYFEHCMIETASVDFYIVLEESNSMSNDSEQSFRERE